MQTWTGSDSGRVLYAAARGLRLRETLGERGVRGVRHCSGCKTSQLEEELHRDSDADPGRRVDITLIPAGVPRAHLAIRLSEWLIESLGISYVTVFYVAYLLAFDLVDSIPITDFIVEGPESGNAAPWESQLLRPVDTPLGDLSGKNSILTGATEAWEAYRSNGSF